MAHRGKIKPHKADSFLKQALQNKTKAAELLKDDFLLVSFRHFDKTQGQSLEQWEAEKILAQGIDVVANSCNSKREDFFASKKCTIYGDFPPKDKTQFTHPKHVPPDAQWARVHVTGKQCIIGHVVANTFYIVFLDKDHAFYALRSVTLAPSIILRKWGCH